MRTGESCNFFFQLSLGLTLFSWARELSILSLERDVFLFAFVASYQWVAINLPLIKSPNSVPFPTLGFGFLLLIQCSHFPKWLHSKAVNWLHYDFYLIENYWNFPWLLEFLVLFFLLIPWHSLIFISRKTIRRKPIVEQLYLLLALLAGAGLTQSEILRDPGFLSLLSLGCGIYYIRLHKNSYMPEGQQEKILSEYWLIIFLCAFWVRQFHDMWWIVFVVLSVLVEGVSGSLAGSVKPHANKLDDESKGWFVHLAFYCFFILGCLSLFFWKWFAPFALFSLLFLMFIPSDNTKSSSTGVVWSLLLIGVMIVLGYQSLNQRALVFFFALCARLLIKFVKSSSWKRFLICLFMLYYCVMNLTKNGISELDSQDFEPRLESWENEKQVSLSGRILFRNVNFDRVNQDLSAQHWMIFNFPANAPKKKLESFIWLDRSDEQLLGFSPTIYLQDLASEVSKQKLRLLWPRDGGVGFAFNIHQNFYEKDYIQFMQAYLEELDSVLLVLTASDYSRRSLLVYLEPLLKKFPTAKVEFRGLLTRVMAGFRVSAVDEPSFDLNPRLYLRNFIQLTDQYELIDLRKIRKSLISDHVLRTLDKSIHKPDLLQEWVLILLRNGADEAAGIILSKLVNQDSLDTQYPMALGAVSKQDQSPGMRLYREWQNGLSNVRLVRGSFLESVFFELLVRNVRTVSKRGAIEFQRENLDPYVRLALLIQMGNLSQADQWRKSMQLKPSNDLERKLLELLHESRGDLTATRFYRP